MSRRSKRARTRLHDLTRLIEEGRPETPAMRLRRVMRGIDVPARRRAGLDAEAHVDLPGRPGAPRSHPESEPA